MDTFSKTSTDLRRKELKTCNIFLSIPCSRPSGLAGLESEDATIETCSTRISCPKWDLWDAGRGIVQRSTVMEFTLRTVNTWLGYSEFKLKY